MVPDVAAGRWGFGRKDVAITRTNWRSHMAVDRQASQDSVQKPNQAGEVAPVSGLHPWVSVTMVTPAEHGRRPGRGGRSGGRTRRRPYQSSCRSALLHTYFPPRLRKVCSSKPLNLMASCTPTSRMDGDGSLRPARQFRKRICKGQGRHGSRPGPARPSAGLHPGEWGGTPPPVSARVRPEPLAGRRSAAGPRAPLTSRPTPLRGTRSKWPGTNLDELGNSKKLKSHRKCLSKDQIQLKNLPP